MIETTNDVEDEVDFRADLRARLDKLENENRDILRQTERRVLLAELKVEAVRAGMIDMDGLSFLDMANIHLDEDGTVSGGGELINELKRAKPWLFSAPSSSSIAKVPPSRSTRQKLATEMTDDEYQVARANIIRRSTF